MSFPVAARRALADTQLRRNMAKATTTIRDKRARVAGELSDWQELRAAGTAIKDRTLADLPAQLERLERSVTEAGGEVHWARDADEANALIAALIEATGERRAVKVKSILSDEIGLNDALAERGIEALETDLAELIVQLSGDTPSHILVPAIHRNRSEIRDLFRRELGARDLPDDPERLTAVAREHLRELFLSSSVAISGANFGIAETGSICVVESEGNGRMCLTLPRTLITVMGIEKLLPSWRELEVFLQLLPRSSTGERMNPYTSIWSGVSEGDGPERFHLVLIDAGRTRTLADEVGRQALRCIRCSACLNSCPVYSRVGGHAYESVYPGPIGAVLTPQLDGLGPESETLPWASSLCGACYEVCPVEIEIPKLLVHLRGEIVDRHRGRPGAELAAMRALAKVFSSRRRYEAAQRLGRAGARPLTGPGGVIGRLPGALSGWTSSRDMVAPAPRSFRDWWRERDGSAGGSSRPGGAVRNGNGDGAGELRAAISDDPPPARGRRVDGEPADPKRAILERIGRALGHGEWRPADPPRDYLERSPLSPDEVIERFLERSADYRAEVHRVDPADAAATVARILSGHEASRVGVPPGLDPEWVADGPETLADDRLPNAELDALDGAVTGCALAIAETGTIVLDAGRRSGRRALTLIPDLHVCVIEASQIVGSVPEAIAELEPAARAGAPITLVSGPSATSDIELSRVEGVHGPRRLEIVVVG